MRSFTRLPTLGLLLGLLLAPSGRHLFESLSSSGAYRTRGPGTRAFGAGRGSETPGLTEALRRCQRDLAQARVQLAVGHRDGPTWLRVASLEMHSANLIALQAYPGTEGNAESHTDPAEHSDFLWRQRFLRSDPEGTLSRAAAAAERALGTNLDRGIRRRGLLLLANARSALGDHAGEVAALADAVRREPHEAMLWMLLARAYREAGRFARAEAALRRADTCLERGSTKP